MNESGNQKGNLSYLAGTKKRSDSLIQLIFHKRGARAGDDARALFLINTVEERVEALGTFMLDRSLALGLRLGPWAASGEDSS
jgi:hypothetical protein